MNSAAHSPGATRIRVLLVEDAGTDVELEVRELKRAGFRVQHRVVETEQTFRNGLAEFLPDIILSDFSMPEFDGMSALGLARELCPDTPFIFVSGTIGEEFAIRALKTGATDYVLKTNLVRLPAAVERALQDAREHAAKREARRALQISEERYRAMFEQTAVGIVHSSLDGSIQMANPRGCDIAGYAHADIIGLNIRDLIYAEDLGESIAARARLVSGDGVPFERELRLMRKDRSQTWINVTTSLVRTADGEPLHFISAFHDISERKAQQDRIARLTRVYAVLSGINALIVRVRDRSELFKGACKTAMEAGKFSLAWIGVVDQAGNRIVLTAWEGDAEGYIQRMPLGLRSDNPASLGLGALAVAERRAMVVNDIESDPRFLLSKDALARGFRSYVALPLSTEDEVTAVLALYAEQPGFFDDEEMKLLNELAGDLSFALGHIAKEEKLNYVALYDSLTGLANRTLFSERLSQTVRAAGQAGTKVALAILDIERLRTVNTSLGRQAGDDLLRHVSGRLARAAGAAEVARISADHFALVVAPVKGELDDGRHFQALLQRCFGDPYQVSDTELRLSAKIGITLYPNDGADAETLLRNAEAALRRGKETDDPMVFYTPSLTEGTSEQLSLLNKLQRALENDEFVLHYQAKVDLQTQRVVGVEALIRWQSPEFGLVPPGKFIPVMEETGIILHAGAWALSRAVTDHSRWLELGLPAPRIAVNVSAIQLRKRDFVETVERAVKRGANPPGIDLEITESLVMEDIESNNQKLKGVRGLGMEIAIDDFGTGYSSLGYLARLPVQTLKIDRSFIITMLKDADTMTLVQTIISLAHSLKLKVVAEGVDEEDQAKLLRLLRCDQVQGYLFSQPVPFDQVTALLKKEMQA